MDEVDDILDQNRAAQNDVDDEEEDEDDDEVDVTLLRNNIDKDGDENNGDRDDEGQDDGQDGDGDEDAEDDEMEQDDDDADDDDDDDEDDDMEGDSDDEDDDEDMDQDRDKNGEENLRRNDGRDVEQADNTNPGEATNGDASKSDEDKSEDESDEYDDQKEDSTAVSREQDVLESVHNYYTQMLSSAKIASTYNIYPTAAIPIQTNVNAISLSKGLQYLFLGGSDGYIRKYDFLNTMDGKLSLTILQKHSLAESIQNAGILVSYWENEVPQKRSEMKMSKNNKEYEPKVSPVYSIEVQNECLFLLSGLENGGITLQGVRYMEGAIGHYFKGKEGHTNVVNHLKLNGDETRFMSGSWDKRILEWDLQTGGITNEFKGSTSEVSSMEMRPLYSTVDISQVASEMKNNEDQEESHNSDDDMGSLFGDDEEENNGEDNKLPESKTEKLDTSSMEEISRSTLNVVYDESTFLTSGLNGSVYIWDRRIPTGPALSLERGPKVPPWCQSACWSMTGDRVFAGRRNAIVEEFDLKMPSHPSNTLKLPAISGPVTCVRAMPNDKQVLCASRDNIRLYNTGSMPNTKGTAVPFLIVPGHHGGAISNMYVDPTCRFLVSTSGSRGWQGNSTDTTFIYEIDLE